MPYAIITTCLRRYYAVSCRHRLYEARAAMPAAAAQWLRHGCCRAYDATRDMLRKR